MSPLRSPILAVTLLLLFASGALPSGQENLKLDQANAQNQIKVYITDTHCGPKGCAHSNHYKCADKCVKKDGYKYQLCKIASEVYDVEPQELVATYIAYLAQSGVELGDHPITVIGTVEGGTIKISKMQFEGTTSYAGALDGWITDSVCGAKGANKGHADCARKCVLEKGAEYVLYNSDDRKLYRVDRQDKAGEHAGNRVQVIGIVDRKTIHATSIRVDAAS